MVNVTFAFTGKRRWPSVFSIGFVIVFTALGFWQLDRAAYKQSIEDTMLANRDLAVVELDSEHMDEIRQQPSIWQFRRVTLRGRYDTTYLVYLDNRVNKGQVGYHVLSVFNLDTGDRIVVNRGWVASGSRDRLPVVAVPSGPQEIIASLGPIAESTFTLGELAPSDQWPQRWTHIDADILSKRLPVAVMPLIAQAVAGDTESALIPQVRELHDTWVDRHRGYALQWFLMALVLALLYARLLWQMRERT